MSFFGYIDDDDDDDDADDVSYLMDRNFIFVFSRHDVHSMIFEKRFKSTQSIVCIATCLSTLIVTIDDDIDEHMAVDK